MISSKTTTAVGELLVDYLGSRTKWDEEPALFTLHEAEPGRVRMVRLPVPDAVWGTIGHPPKAVEAIAAAATVMPRRPDGSHGFVSLGVGRLIGAAFHCEAYALDSGSQSPAVEEAIRRRSTGGTVPMFKDIPGRIEQRCMAAIDLDGGRYMSSSSRIDESKPEASEPVVQYLAFGDPARDRIAGRVVDAVNRLLNAVKPIPQRGDR
ncbi:hypothetical protein [Streptomyces sp. NPDC059759]|uniref:hypothetical protein n=1 Tax=Streptomyces sp. NPDC059759 TaxID=3346936 RepID=UPI003647A042